LLPWQTWTDSTIPRSARASDLVYERIRSPRWERQPLCSKESKPSPTRRFPPTNLIAAELHRDPAGAVIAAPQRSQEGRWTRQPWSGHGWLS
jgi:hypothetical protein